MKTIIQIELTRNNVTPAAFLAYVRNYVDKKGGKMIRSDLDLNYFKSGNDLNFDYRNDPEKPCKAEKSVSRPYEMQTYIQNWDGSIYNEICEFTFDDEKTGHGYYYLINTEADVETEENTEKETEEKKMNHVVNGVYADSAFGGIEVSLEDGNGEALYYRFNYGDPGKWHKVKIYETTAGRFYFKASGKRIYLDEVMRT